MNATIVSYRRGRHVLTTNQAILKIPSINDKSQASKFVSKKVIFKTPSGKNINGLITAVHGDNGRVRARFDKGLPGQAIGREVSLK